MENSTTPAETTLPPAEEITLEILDLAVCKQIIETATERGAFRADELHIVGLTYDRISHWLALNVPKETTESAEMSVEQGEKND
jgi:hypothetical protein